MLYHCKNCKSYQNWWKCTNCGNIVCLSCALKGVGDYQKMRAQNTCAYCKYSNRLVHLKGTEDELKNYGK